MTDIEKQVATKDIRLIGFPDLKGHNDTHVGMWNSGHSVAVKCVLCHFYECYNHDSCSRYIWNIK